MLVNEVCRFPGDYKTKDLTKTLKTPLEKQICKISRILHVTPSEVICRNPYVKFPEKLVLLPGKSCKTSL